MIAQQEMQTHHFAREGLGVDTEGPGTCGQHFEDVLLDVLLKIFFLVRCTLKLRFSYKQRTKLLLFTVVIYSLQKKKYFSRQYFHTDRFLYQNLVIFSVVEKGFYICSSFQKSRCTCTKVFLKDGLLFIGTFSQIRFFTLQYF